MRGSPKPLRRRGLFVLLAGALLLSGCTNNPYPDEDDGRKVYYSSFSEPPKTLDPATSYTTTEHVFTGIVFDTLLEYHYLKRPYELVPALAEEVPLAEPLGDGRVRYTFTLRPELLFQDDECFRHFGGQSTRRITAHDFVFELKRIADPSVNSPVAEPFGNLVGFTDFTARLDKLGKEAGFAKLSARERYRRAGEIEGVQALDDRRLRLTLSAAYPQILYWFAMPVSTPMPWEAVEYYTGKDERALLQDHPVGSGPYFISEYDKQARIVVTRNPNWYGLRHPEWRAPGTVFPSEGEPGDFGPGRLDEARKGTRLAQIERAEYRREKESIPAFTKFMQGYFDASGIISESFDKVVRDDNLSEEMQRLGMRLDKSVETTVFYIGFNLEDKVVGHAGGEKSRKLRQAMSLVVDSDEWLRLFTNGRGIPAQSPLPPGLFGYDEAYRNPYRKVDVARAKRLLAEAGYPGGIDPATKRPLHLTYDIGDTSPELRQMVQFHVNRWRELGIDVEVAATTYNKFQQKVREGAYQVFQWGWAADYPDPENFLFLLWSAMARSKNNGPNSANFQNAAYDRLFLEMKSMDNTPARREKIQQMLGILEEERPWIELYHRESYSLYHGWFAANKSAGLSLQTLKYADVDPKLRQQRREEWNRPVLWPVYLFGLLALMVVVPGVRSYLKERQ
jgi:oligopeptide transport system substrate-binding protein